MNWLYYLLEANLYLGIFYITYYVFLSRETWYTLNRAYLLLSCVISFVLPFIQLGILKPVVHTVAVAKYAMVGQPVILSAVKEAPVVYHFTWQDGLFYGYLLGAAVLLLMLLLKLYQLLKLAQSNKKQPDSNYKLVYLNDTNTAFSFFNFLFIGTKAEGKETIIRHELVHIRQKHSADIVFLELLKIVNWFNPFIYLIQISLRAVHEYIADEKTAPTETDALAYSTFLVNNAYGLSGSTITHSFFNYNLLKKRIIMLNQQRSGSLARLKYLMAVPICAGLVCASTLAFSKNYVLLDLFPQKTDTDHIAPPPPPAPPVVMDEHHLPPPPPPIPPGKMVVFPAPKTPVETTAKGYKYAEGGEMVNGKVYLNVTIYDKDGNHKQYFKGSATLADIKLLKDKYGYTFPAKPNFNHFAPPPPPKPPVGVIVPAIVPAPPSVKAVAPVAPIGVVVTPMHNAPQSPVAAPITTIHIVAATPVAPIQTVHLLPPPPPFDPAYKDLSDHLEQSIYYPADAKTHNVYGIVEARFSLDADNKISNVEIIKGLPFGCDDAVKQALSSYKQPITRTGETYYDVQISFNLVDEYDKMNTKDFDSNELVSPNYALAMYVSGSKINK